MRAGYPTLTTTTSAGVSGRRSLRLSASMATSLATHCLIYRPSLGPPSLVSSTSSSWLSSSRRLGCRPSPPLRYSSPPADAAAAKPEKGGEYRPSFVDDLLLAFFRSKMVEVRVVRSLFPPLLLRSLAPIANGQLASMMDARATALSCQWLVGPCSVNSVTLPDGKSCSSGVFVDKMQVSGRKQMPWHLHQHVQTTNSDFLQGSHGC